MFHPVLMEDDIGTSVKAGMTAAEYVIFFFSFFFVLYSISTFLKARQKEFGILEILGAEQSQIYRIVFIENITIGALSIGSGLGIGLLFSKLFLLLSTEITDLDGMNFYFPVEAILLTAGAFAALFVIISFSTILYLRKQQTTDLLKGTSKPKTEPKASIFLSLLSVVCISGAFLLMQEDIGWYLYILGLGTIGTYFFFTQLSVYSIRLLKRNQLFFYRGVTLLWLSEMAYKIKDSARIFFVITVITAMASGFISIVLSGDNQNKQDFMKIHFPIQYESTTPEGENNVKTIDRLLASKDIAFNKIQFESTPVNFDETNTGFGPISLSVYEQLKREYSLPEIDVLAEDEVVVFHNITNTYTATGERQTKDFLPISTLIYEDFSFKVKKQEVVDMPDIWYGNLTVMSDDQYEKFLERMKQRTEGYIFNTVLYQIPEWANKELPKEGSDEVKTSSQINSQINEEEGHVTFRSLQFLQTKQAYSITKFVWIFIAAIFSVASISFLYFKLYSDLQADQRMYQSLSRIGLTEGEMSRSASIQLSVLFFLPLLIASLGSVITVELLRPSLGFETTINSSLLAVSGYAIVQIIFFTIIRALYVRKLKQAMY